MTQSIDTHQILQDQVHQLLELAYQEPDLHSQDVSAIQSSLRKAVSPTFEIVFAGAFSAGKSMLINALLERKLLYSAEGHATGTECQIAYAEPGQERVVLTFLSQVEIFEQAKILIQSLGFMVNGHLEEALSNIQATCQQIVQEEGGESRSDRAKRASALNLLIEGSVNNENYIQPEANATYPMEHFNFSTLQEAAGYARRGANSSVLKRIEYYCHDELLKDGNVLIDTPGIDAPVKKDAELTYDKIRDPDTSAVICVLKPAETGELTTEETDLLETVRSNIGIRDRVFYTFNRIDKTWYAPELRQRLESILHKQFQNSDRVYQTSALLGFYGSQIRKTDRSDRFGLDTLLAEATKGNGAQEEAPLFVTEFNNYCANSRKLIGSPFRPEVRGYEHPNENYVRILSENGTPLIEQLINDSGVETFRTAITRYLTEEKRPQLFAALVDDLQPLCEGLRAAYIQTWQHLDSQPRNVEAIQEQELRQLNSILKTIGDDLQKHLEQELNQVAASKNNRVFEGSFIKLQSRMVKQLDALLNQFSVAIVHQQAQANHKRNSVVPLLGILAEAFYYLANGLEETLVDASQELVVCFFQHLRDQIQQQDYYSELLRVLGSDSGIEQQLTQLQEQACHAIRNEARLECDRYVREQPGFYAEGTVSVWQLQQTMQQACGGYDYQSMVDAEPAIRQLLKLDFEQKVQKTVMTAFRQTVNQTLINHLLPTAQKLADSILQQQQEARIHLAKTLAAEAEETLKENQRRQEAVRHKIESYNNAITSVKRSLGVMPLGEQSQKLPEIQEPDLMLVPVTSEPPTNLETEMQIEDSEASQVTDSELVTAAQSSWR
ncbi:MAG: dynamin family protein [Thermosynechococcaceae cyanobacterium]